MTQTLIQGDFLQVADQIEDNSIDLVLTDPPYNISEIGAKPVWIDKETGENKNNIHSQKFSESFDEDWDQIDHEAFINQMVDWAVIWQQKLRKGGSFVVFISDRYLSFMWKILEDVGLEPKRAWTWKKPAAVPFNRKTMPVSGCEYIVWGIKPGGKRTFNSDCPVNGIVDRYSVADKVSNIVYKMVKDNTDNLPLEKIFEKALAEAKQMVSERKQENNISFAVIPNTITYSGGLGKNRIHPTQKPTEILEYFIELCSNPGDLILDSFAGSGSTGIAARNLARSYIMIERDDKMFKAMSDRFNSGDQYNNLFLES